MPDRIRRQELVRAALVVWLPLAAVLVAAVVVTQSSAVTMRMLMQDATTVLGGPFYTGAVSLLGVIGWAAATAVCMFGALVLAREREWRSFLLVSAVLTGVMLFDDAYLLHDEILPQSTGINGELLGVVYVLATLALVIRFRGVIRQSNWLLLGAALVFFAVSAMVDVLSSRLSEIVPAALVEFGEDGPKLFGIGTWLAYFVSVARQVAAAQGSGAEAT